MQVVARSQHARTHSLAVVLAVGALMPTVNAQTLSPAAQEAVTERAGMLFPLKVVNPLVGQLECELMAFERDQHSPNGLGPPAIDVYVSPANGLVTSGDEAAVTVRVPLTAQQRTRALRICMRVPIDERQSVATSCTDIVLRAPVGKAGPRQYTRFDSNPVAKSKHSCYAQTP